VAFRLGDGGRHPGAFRFGYQRNGWVIILLGQQGKEGLLPQGGRRRAGNRNGGYFLIQFQDQVRLDWNRGDRRLFGQVFQIDQFHLVRFISRTASASSNWSWRSRRVASARRVYCKTNSTLPKRSLDPGLTWVSPPTRVPLTKVPLELPWSFTCQKPSWKLKTQCFRLISGEGMRRLTPSALPTVITGLVSWNRWTGFPGRERTKIPRGVCPLPVTGLEPAMSAHSNRVRVFPEGPAKSRTPGGPCLPGVLIAHQNQSPINGWRACRHRSGCRPGRLTGPQRSRWPCGRSPPGCSA